jgi:hypothetical protein
MLSTLAAISGSTPSDMKGVRRITQRKFEYPSTYELPELPTRSKEEE